MPRRCTICDHVERHAINVALVQRDSYRHIASYYDVSTRALQRHSQKHLPKLLVEASRGVEVANADDLLAKVEELRLKAMDVLTQAEEAHDHRIVLAAIDRASKQLELLAKLLGEISDAPQVNIHLHPEWIELRTVIVGALEAHPEARGAVLRAIEGVDNGR